MWGKIPESFKLLSEFLHLELGKFLQEVAK